MSIFDQMSGQCQSQREKEAKPYILPGSVLNITKMFLAVIVNANVNLKERKWERVKSLLSNAAECPSTLCLQWFRFCISFMCGFNMGEYFTVSSLNCQRQIVWHCHFRPSNFTPKFGIPKLHRNPTKNAHKKWQNSAKYHLCGKITDFVYNFNVWGHKYTACKIAGSAVG